MDWEMQEAITDPLMEEFATLRAEADTKAKVTLVHILNDVTVTITRINSEVCFRLTRRNV